ncbi:MAG: ABC transporter permease subunit [Bacteroidales bacterium]|nr:ABC transporter permease subunit [Bacteroidales bacterium]
MNGNLMLNEFRINLLSFALWLILICFFVAFTMAFYPMFIENQSQFMGLFNLFPTGLFEFKGISNFDDLFSVLGFYAANNAVYMQLFGSIYAIILGSNILLKEEYNKTADFLLSRPLTRSEVYLTKTAVMVFYILILNIIVILTGYLSIEFVKTGPYDLQSYLILSLYTFLLNLLFGFTGLFISTLIKRARPFTTLGIGIVLFMYFLYTISKITDEAEKLGYISPYRFVDANVLNPDYALNPWFVLYFAGLVIFLALTAFFIYKRKDIYV